MFPPENADTSDDAQLFDELVEAGIYSSENEAFEHGLVVLAEGFPYWLVPYEGGFRLMVEPEGLAASRRQLELFERESRGWPPVTLALPAPKGPSSVMPSLLWTLATIGVFRAQEIWPGRLEAAGVLDAQKVFAHGEVWRIATALFLHGNAAHLTANLASGFFVFSAVLTGLGRLRGAALLVLAALVGNAAVVSLNSSRTYQSLGASTAVFAGLGVLTGAALRRAFQQGGSRRWRPLFPPLAAGLTLLGLFGAGDLRTDVAAHACGFTAGVLCGAIAGQRQG